MRNKTSAFTLLEVILALGLSTLVMVALSMAVSLHLRLLDTGRTKVEEAQLARAILQNIARDLRGAIPYSTPKSGGNSFGSSTKSTSQSGNSGKAGGGSAGGGSAGGGSAGGGSAGGGSAGGGSAGGGSAGGGSAGGGSAGGGSAGGGATTTDTGVAADGTTEEDRTTDLADAAPQAKPGLYGNAYELQIDVSRLPRADQYIAMANQAEGMTNADQLTDVKNVSYFIVNNGVSAAPAALDGTAALTGLIRREVGRASGVFASQQAQSTTTTALEPFAPEVQSIQFSYFDGTQWLDTWDSVSCSGLPLAVQISIAIAPQRPRGAAVQPDIYRLTVSIPAAKPLASQSTSTTDTSSTSTSTSTSNPSP